MAMMIVGSEKNLSQLKPRLFTGRVSRASLAKVNAAVVAANPTVDVTRLKPGMVLTIPDVPDVKMEADLSVDDITRKSIEQVSQQFDAALETAAGASVAALKRSKAERAKISKVIGSAQVTRATRSNKELASEVKATKAALAAQDELDKAQSISTKNALRQWAKDLDNLRSLIGDQ